MKHLASVALVVGLIALPVCAQRGGSHGGFSGHAAPVSRGGFAASAPGRSSGNRSFPGGRAPGLAGNLQIRTVQRGSVRSPGARPPYTGSWRYRRPYFSRDRARISFGFPGYGWVPPYFLGFPDDTDYDDSSTAPGNVPEGYPEEPADEGQQVPLGPYQPNFEMASPAPAPAREEAVTLIFKDGRPPEQIHNYLLTRSTLYVGDLHRHAIPTDQLDLVATARVNQEAGVEFRLPDMPQ